MSQTGLFHAWEAILGIGITIAVMIVACHLPAIDPPALSTLNETILSRTLYSSRKAFGADFYRRADEYYHKGISHTRPASFAHDPFRRLLDIVSPERHVHATAQETKEVIPWLRFATAMDPHNIEAYLVTAYLLQTALNNPDMADSVLAEAQRTNPGNYSIVMERGRLALKKQMTDRARDFFDMAIRLWPGTNTTDSAQLRLDRAEMLTYRALLHEYANEPEQAIAMLQEVARLFPDRKHLLTRVAELRDSRKPTISATRVWKGMLSIQANPHICTRDLPENGGSPAASHNDHSFEGALGPHDSCVHP